MSFVFAEKNNNTLNIHCDTKIGLDDSSIPLYSCEQKEAIEKYGIVKTTIICPEISISFAGNNIHLASKLFVQLSEKKLSLRKKSLIWPMISTHLVAMMI